MLTCGAASHGLAGHPVKDSIISLGTIFALSSALLYGIVDFAGGKISRQISGIAFAYHVQLTGLAAALAFVPLAPETLRAGDLGWGALSGLGSGMAIMFLYTGMGKGKISQVVPVVAVLGAAIPVLVSIFLLGERPGVLALSGVVLALPSIWMVSGAGRPGDDKGMDGLSDCLVAGLGVALQYTAMGHVSAESGVWPLVANRTVSIMLVVAYGRTVGRRLHIPAGYLWSALWIGAAASGSLALYALSTRYSMLSISVVLSSLYPVIPTVLAVWLLRERLVPIQLVGLMSAAAAVVLITVE